MPTDTEKVRYSGKTGSEPRAVKLTRLTLAVLKLEKSKDDKNNFPKSIATEQACEVFDDQKQHLVECSFYAIAAALRFCTAKR
jgi:hypothetical protein